MKKLARPVKLRLLISSLAILPFANAANQAPSIKVDDAKTCIEAAGFLIEEGILRVEEACWKSCRQSF